MGARSVKKHVNQKARDVLAANLRALRDARPGSERAFFRRIAAVPRTTIRHVLDAGASVDTIALIALIARAFGLEPWQLLAPGLGLAVPRAAKPAKATA